MGNKPFTQEQIKEIDDFVLSNYTKLTTRQIANALNVSVRTINRAKLRVKVKTPKELIWHNTTTQFKSGAPASSRKPLYHEFFNEEKQQVFIKYKEGKSNNYKQKKNFIWEQVNGKVPDGYIVRHRDKNPFNNEIENLYLISKADVMSENSFNRYPNEIRANCNLIAKIKRQISHE